MRVGHVEAAKLITVLEGYDNLAKLSLHDSGFERRESYVALASILQDPRHMLKELNLSLKNNNGIRTVSMLANAVEKNRTLISFGLYGCANIQEVISIALAQNITCGRSTVRSINLTNSSFDLSGFRKFAACLSSPNCSLRKLSLYNCSLDDQMATELGYGLNNNTTLRVLELGRNSSITLAGWQSILVCLRPSSSIEKLKINDCGIVDEVADEIATALAGNSTLKRLYMNSSSVSASTWQRFSACLCNPNLVLEKLDLSGYHNNTNINSDTVVAFANALTLVNDTRLHSLLVINGWGADDFINFGNYTIDDRCRQVLSNLLCNKADIESIYTSNHTLHTLSSCGFAKDATPKDIASYLKLNENDDKVEVARQKILQYHFVNGTSNIEEFVDMECGELPRALAWVGRNNTGRSLLYKMCQSMPSIFDTKSKTNVTGAKRKYGC